MYIKERCEKITNQLLSLSSYNKTAVVDILYKDGNFLNPDLAEKDPQDWKPFNPDTDKWGGFDLHTFFKANITVPKDFENKSLSILVVSDFDQWDFAAPQMLCFINGQVAQGIDKNHRDVFITNKAKAGAKFEFCINAYGFRCEYPLKLKLIMYSTDTEVLGLYYDIVVPLRIIEKLEKDDYTRIRYENVLEETVNLIDLRKPYSKEFTLSIEEARRCIQKGIYTDMANKSDSVATCVGHTHIDVAWWWTVEETREKAIRSFSTVLKYLDEFPEYIFMSSQPQLYKFVKERYPEVFEEIKKRVKEGRFEPEGGMWLESDCNVTSGESLVRQFIHGKKFFKDEFNVENEILWLPDVFGYNGAMPQILKKSEIDYFMTTKIAWNQFNKFPYDTFMWQGIDGTSVFTHLITTKEPTATKDSFFTTYNGQIHPGSVIGAFERYQQKDINNDVLISYGFGDGGGGPTKEMIETGKRLQAGLPGVPKVRFGTALNYFKELEKRVINNKKLPKWAGELYLEYHRGTYTSMARNKKSNRVCENRLMDLEFLSVLASEFAHTYPKDKIFDMWENVLLNQFHDILPGSSIKEVYDVTKQEYTELESNLSTMIKDKLEVLASHLVTNKDSLVVFNTLSFDRNDILEIEPCEKYKSFGLKDANGTLIDTQVSYDNKLLAHVKNIPPKGYKILTLSPEQSSLENKMIISDKGIENDFYKIDFDKTFAFTKIYDKKACRDALKPGMRGNVLKVYEDKPMNYDNWDIDLYYVQKSWEVDNVVSYKWLEKGPIRAVLQVERDFSGSKIIQKYKFYSHTARIDFETYVDWKLSQHLLKVLFPVDINSNEATYEIQFGNIKRPTHKNTTWDIARFEVCGHKWADISEGDFGVSLLNDCKYGYDFTDNNMQLTLIKAGIEPNPTTDIEEHNFTYSLFVHACDLKNSNTAKEAYMLNFPMFYQYPQKVLGTTSDASKSFISINCDNVMVETIKQAENGNATIVRLYEYKNQRKNVTATFSKNFSKICTCNLMEKDETSLTQEGFNVSFDIKPYEIITLKLYH